MLFTPKPVSPYAIGAVTSAGLAVLLIIIIVFMSMRMRVSINKKLKKNIVR